MQTKRIKVGILIFNEVEVLDFAGPFEVFSLAESVQTKEKLFEVFTVAERSGVIRARNGLQVLPDYNFDDSPLIDILIVPGGYGAEEVEIKNHVLLNWLKKMEPKAKTVASVCTGAFLLAEAGILKNHQVTTHWMDTDKLQEMYPHLDVQKNAKYIDQGKVLSSAGISAGIELSLYLVMKYSSREEALATARRMEYDCDFLTNTL
ncbi:MAG TPA: DJ-1/PfpI family protein [Sediminispirochaeta sp.]|nr:DJ-1/PfpI family protein [Sediminispirochaeta sp.]